MKILSRGDIIELRWMCQQYLTHRIEILPIRDLRELAQSYGIENANGYNKITLLYLIKKEKAKYAEQNEDQKNSD